MTISQAAKYLRVTNKTLKIWDKQGKLVPMRTGKRNDRLYTQEIINQFIESHYV